jgi:ketosteroid isomerase-like protein
MKTKILRISCIGIAVIALSCQKKKEEPLAVIDTIKILDEIRLAEAAFYNYIDARNPEAAVAYFADDAERFSSHAASVKGKKAILEYLKARIASVPKGFKAISDIKEIYPSADGKQIVKVGTILVLNGKDTIATGNTMSYFEKRDGRYLCVKDMCITEDAKQ